ncbi:MAG TPA: hypothetical protein VGX92_04110 [Pyrinomonadaceae bacterium]|nr:hypothetical protein [Pyrinomonadaceae bacterium]
MNIHQEKRRLQQVERARPPVNSGFDHPRKFGTGHLSTVDFDQRGCSGLPFQSVRVPRACALSEFDPADR